MLAEVVTIMINRGIVNKNAKNDHRFNRGVDSVSFTSRDKWKLVPLRFRRNS